MPPMADCVVTVERTRRGPDIGTTLLAGYEWLWAYVWTKAAWPVCMSVTYTRTRCLSISGHYRLSV